LKVSVPYGHEQLLLDLPDTANVDVLETDIRLTKDRIPVIFHDATLDRTTNGKGFIIDHTYEELQEFDLGYWYKDLSTNEYPFRNRGFRIISLLELFEKFPDIRINMDIMFYYMF